MIAKQSRWRRGPGQRLFTRGRSVFVNRGGGGYGSGGGLGGGNLCDPVLPATVDTTYSLPGGTLWTPADDAAYQNALDNAALGDVIQLTAGAVYSGAHSYPVKTGTGWIYIVSSGLGSLPAAGTRCGPGDVSHMPTLRMTNSSVSVMETVGAVHHYRFVGIHVDVLSSITDTFGRAPIIIGADATSSANQPHHIIWDRCYLQGRDGTGPGNGLSMTRPLLLGGAYMAFIDGYVSEVHASGADSQAILIYNGSGPYKIHNSHLEAAGENVMIGGANPSDSSLLPSDITITRDYFFKPLGWIGLGWSVKNLLELKMGVRVLIEGNVFANCWAQAQAGYAWVFWSASENAGAPFTETRDVLARKNKIINVASFAQLTNHSSTGTVVDMTKVKIEQNVAEKINDVGGQSALLGGSIKAFQITGVNCLQLIHNTVAPASDTLHSQQNFAGAVSDRYTDRDNIYGFSTGGVVGDSDGTGAACYTTYTTNNNIHRELFAGDAGGSHQADCNYAANEAGIGYVDEAGGDYHLSGSSPYKGTGDDGLDPGADIDAVAAATAGVTD